MNKDDMLETMPKIGVFLYFGTLTYLTVLYAMGMVTPIDASFYSLLLMLGAVNLHLLHVLIANQETKDE